MEESGGMLGNLDRRYGMLIVYTIAAAFEISAIQTDCGSLTDTEYLHIVANGIFQATSWIS